MGLLASPTVDLSQGWSCHAPSPLSCRSSASPSRGRWSRTLRSCCWTRPPRHWCVCCPGLCRPCTCFALVRALSGCVLAMHVFCSCACAARVCVGHARVLLWCVRALRESTHVCARLHVRGIGKSADFAAPWSWELGGGLIWRLEAGGSCAFGMASPLSLRSMASSLVMMSHTLCVHRACQQACAVHTRTGDAAAGLCCPHVQGLHIWGTPACACVPLQGPACARVLTLLLPGRLDLLCCGCA